MKAYVMCGAPGSGKSTIARSLPGDPFIASLDSVRGELYGDENIQGNYAEVGARYNELIRQNKGRLLVLDNTHYRKSYRKEALRLLRSLGYQDVTLIVVNPSLETCLLQNSSRERKVPEEVIERMHSAIQVNLPTLPMEGFTKIENHHGFQG